MTELSHILIPCLIGSILGSSLFRILLGKSTTIGVLATLLGMVAGGFLGTFAGMVLTLAFHKTDEWPINYWIPTISAALFTAGFLKFIRDNVQK